MCAATLAVHLHGTLDALLLLLHDEVRHGVPHLLDVAAGTLVVVGLGSGGPRVRIRSPIPRMPLDASDASHPGGTSRSAGIVQALGEAHLQERRRCPLLVVGVAQLHGAHLAAHGDELVALPRDGAVVASQLLLHARVLALLHVLRLDPAGPRERLPAGHGLGAQHLHREHHPIVGR
eukprot:11182621-Lingulodinium_polyedra.AAC.1